MTPLQILDQAEVEFRDHCREKYEAPALVYQQDSTLIEQMARKIAAVSFALAEDIAKLNARDNPNPTPVSDIAQMIGEALDRDMGLEAASLLSAHLKHLVPSASAQSRAA